MTKGRKLLVVGFCAVFACLSVAIVAGIGLYIYMTRPIATGTQLGDGTITAVVTDHLGPIAIAAYVFELRDGTVGLIDTGSDPDAANIGAVLARSGRTLANVSAILLTHGHDDHAGGVAAFPEASVFALHPDVEAIRRRRDLAGAKGKTVALNTDELFNLAGEQVEVFSVPGHTRGSAAFLLRGALFLGDSAQSMRDGTFGPNRIMSEDGDATVRSLRSLAKRLESRRSEVRHVAFGHSGPLEGLDQPLKWAAAQ